MRRRRDTTPDAHLFATRPYDLVKEMVVALVAVSVLTVALAAVLSSPDEKAISLRDWASAAPADVVATVTSELAGTSSSAGYGAPYNTGGPGQDLGPLHLQRWAGVRVPVDPAQALVIDPLNRVASAISDASLQTALRLVPSRELLWSRDRKNTPPGGRRRGRARRGSRIRAR